ncbi:hypothetical protein [Pedobacter glucosidilyticus]|uniref:hypothetical protein n=1 Tax=Pedobacter glucosidilyticus TaxID=1122941 RepID=UPI0003FC2FB9|nr:hypothetical protein [Pedobacter glucosidilyticus]
MAIIDKKGRIHGKIGNLVYRTVGDTEIVQTKAAKVKQTLSTKESAMEFGLASNCGRILRSVFSTFCCNSDGKMINRLNVTLLKCIKDNLTKERGNRDLHDGNLEHLLGFQFNAHSPMNMALAVRPLCFMEAGRLKVKLPEIKENTQLQQLKYGRHAVLRLMLVAVNFRENYYEYLSYQDIDIAKGAVIPEQEWNPDVVLPPGSILLVSASLHYSGLTDVSGQAQSINSKDFSPAELIGAFHISEEESTQLVETAEEERMRYPLDNYRGEEILKEINKKRGKNSSSPALKPKTVVVKATDKKETVPEVPIGKVFYQTELNFG